MAPAKIALVSGTTSGLGKALAEKLLASGIGVIGVNRRADEELKGHQKFQNHVIDITSTEEVTRLLVDLKTRGLEVDLFLLNAGITDVDFGGALDMGKFRSVLETNLYGALSFVSAVQQMALTRKTIVFISTTSVYVPNKGSLGYYVAKLGLTKIRKLLQFGDALNKYKIVILGPTTTNLNHKLPALEGLASKVFSALSQTPESEASRILRFCNSNRTTLRPRLKTYLFYRLLKALVFVVPGVYYKTNFPLSERAHGAKEPRSAV